MKTKALRNHCQGGNREWPGVIQGGNAAPDRWTDTMRRINSTCPIRAIPRCSKRPMRSVICNGRARMAIIVLEVRGVAKGTCFPITLWRMTSSICHSPDTAGFSCELRRGALPGYSPGAGLCNQLPASAHSGGITDGEVPASSPRSGGGRLKLGCRTVVESRRGQRAIAQKPKDSCVQQSFLGCGPPKAVLHSLRRRRQDIFDLCILRSLCKQPIFPYTYFPALG